MEIRHLRYFVAVAESLNFSVAAQRLHMSQPPLSKRIADLEEEIGARLFDRSSRQVALTSAGRSLLPQAKSAVDAFDATVRVARAVSPTRSRQLTIALPIETSREVLLDIVNQLQRVNAEISISEATTAEQHRLLLTGELDIGVLRYPFDLRGLRASASLQQTLGVLLHIKHPLADHAEILLSDLSSYPLVMFPRTVAPGLYDEMLSTCNRDGYVPKRVLHGVRMTATLLISEGAVAFTTSALSKTLSVGGLRDLTWKPLVGEPLHWWTAAVCRSSDRDPIICMAVNVVLQALQAHDQWIPKPRPKPSRSLRRTNKAL